jgi:glycerate 2-kinase
MIIIIAPTAFKHSLSPRQAATAIELGIRTALPDATCIALPIADGGNGTLDAWLASGGTRHSARVHDPLMRPIDADYGILHDGKTAIIEMARASGIELLAHDEHDALHTTTYGTGELIQAAYQQGARRFIIGMGGSATVDGGAGALQALDVRLRDQDGRDLAPGGEPLARLAQIDTRNLAPRWQDCEFIFATDVDNPLLGATGAAAVFAPQKGATPAQVTQLAANLSHFADVMRSQQGVDVRTVAGGGAAGGLAAGLLAFLGGRITSGIDLLLAEMNVVEQLDGAQVVITGEGQIDVQTMQGKAVLGIARLAARHDVPTIALVGRLNAHDRHLHDAGIHAVLPIVDQPMSLADALQRADDLLERAALRLGYIISAIRD